VNPLPETTDHDGDDLLALRAIAGRLDPADVVWETPPDDLWDRISAEAHMPSSPSAVAPVHDLSAARDASTERRGRSTGPLTWILAAAAAVVVIAVGGWLVSSPEDEPTVVASSTLDQLQDVGAGSAELIDRDGTLQLRLDTSGIEAGDEDFLEVWVIDPEVSQLVSLGPLREDGLYDLPAGLDPEAFPIVDVSVEPIDGDPTHSGDSLLRGQLQF
jgi:anti-sigma-K factor RskA